MSTAVAPPPAATPEAPPAIEPAPFKPKRKRPSIGLIFACTFLFVLVFLAVFADYLGFIRYPVEKVLVDGRAGRYKLGPGSEAWFGTDGLSHDVFAGFGLLSRFMSAGFYYKTFLGSRVLWDRVYEPALRRMAGFGCAPELPIRRTTTGAISTATCLS